MTYITHVDMAKIGDFYENGLLLFFIPTSLTLKVFHVVDNN